MKEVTEWLLACTLIYGLIVAKIWFWSTWFKHGHKIGSTFEAWLDKQLDRLG